MRTIPMCAAILAAACSSAPSASTAPTAGATAGGEGTLALSVPAPGHAPLREAPDATLPDFEAGQLASLPPAPWTEGQVAAGEAPAVVMAWATAENRTWCAPLAPALANGVPARASELDGGWVVEFDQEGMPGVGADGEPCADCGRGVFGVAGTAMGVDEMLEAPAPSFADGSAVEVVDDEVAAATVAIRGQGCVYQVWSFLGREHLESLLGQLRFVDTGRVRDEAVAGLDIPYEP